MIIIGSLRPVVLGRRLSRPIYSLMTASRAIDEGRYYDYRIKERRNDENRSTDGLLQRHGGS